VVSPTGVGIAHSLRDSAAGQMLFWDPMNAPRPDEVHSWLVDLGNAVASASALRDDLTPDDRAHADSMVTPARRDELIVRRGALRRILATYLHQPAASIRFTPNSAGKPEVVDASFDCRFNVSHSGSHMVVAVTAARAIGVDVQVIRPRTRCLDLARRFFSPSEVQSLSRVPADEIESAFFDLWTLKEAWVKCLGAGIAYGLHRFTIDAQSDPPRLIDVDNRPAPPFQLQRVSVERDVPGALAVEGDAPVSVKRMRWSAVEALPELDPET
jgi:4'-phosphopantetheinyl transferase